MESTQHVQGIIVWYVPNSLRYNQMFQIVHQLIWSNEKKLL